MVINYVEKGIGMHDAIIAAGHWLHFDSAIGWVSSDEAAVQAIIDAYDPVPPAKEAKIKAINAECKARLIARFGEAHEQVSRSIGVYGTAEKTALESGVAAMIDASNVASNAVLAATTVAAVEAVAATWPNI